MVNLQIKYIKAEFTSSILFFWSFIFLRLFEQRQTIWPPSADEKGLFGRSVSFSNSRIAISAEYISVPGFINHNKNFTGVVYIYDYNATDNSIKISKGNGNNRLEPEKVVGISPGTLGSKIILSVDGKTLLAGAPYSDIKTDYSDDIAVDPKFAVKTVEYLDGQYYSEVGALYLFSEKTDGTWKQEYVSVPQNVICNGGYGRSMSGSFDLSYFAGSYYNKILPNLPEIIGQVFVTRKLADKSYTQSQVISPPAEINNSKTQRFGAGLSFHQNNKLYITSLAEKPEAQKEGDEGGVFEYQLLNNEWKLVSQITANNAKSFDQFGIKSSFKKDSIAAIYGRKNTNPKQHNVFILPKVNGIWSNVPQQTISFMDEEISDLFFCSSKNSTSSKNEDFLAVVISNYILIYEKDENSAAYVLFQNITEPKVVQKGVKIPYDQQGVEFGSDFSWEYETCSRFIVGAMGKYGKGKDTVPNEFSRAYIYEIGKVQEAIEKNIVGIAVGVSVAVAVIIIFIILAIMLVRRRNRERDGHFNIDLISKSSHS